MSVKNFDQLVFDNRFTRHLPGDAVERNFRRVVSNAAYSRVLPKQVAKPELIAYWPEVAELLDLPTSLDTAQSQDFAQVLTGNRLTESMSPFAMYYGGHQFGQWADQLGDGRVINLGEVLNDRGEHWMIQLKGAGPTPYSRTADGLAVLRSSIREFLCSEAMHHLGIPTTRALSLSLTGESVWRDMFYDGRPAQEPGAIVCRVAPTFTRFGNFEIFSTRNDIENLSKLVDWTIRWHFPHLIEETELDSQHAQSREVKEKRIFRWFEEIGARTAEMIVHWMRVGFVHGVMNTDNMSILGLTIDYGPYGWMENYDPEWTPNTTDAQMKRYTYANQAEAAIWNLHQLGTALHVLFEDSTNLHLGMMKFIDTYNQGWLQMTMAKLGLTSIDGIDDSSLIMGLYEAMQSTETDMTIFHRSLANLDIHSEHLSLREVIRPVQDAFYNFDELSDSQLKPMAKWLETYRQRVRLEKIDPATRIAKMNKINPKYVLRNYLAQLAIDQATNGNYEMLHRLMDVLRRPYDEQPEHEQLAEKRPEWARSRPGCSTLSCSS